MKHDFNQIQKNVNKVTKDILKRFPKCSYTIKILLWDDGTYSVECRHGDGAKIFISYIQENKLYYLEEDILANAIVIDEKGNDYYAIQNENKPDEFYRGEQMGIKYK